jgi:hypothetical protein
VSIAAAANGSFRVLDRRFWFFLALIGVIGFCPLVQAGSPNLGPMTFLPGDGTLGPAAGDQITPAIARGGTQYLAVWQDDRGASQDIYAARIDASGAPIDTTPLAITQAAGAQTSPRVAWNGSNWLVAWESQIPTQFYYSYGVLAVRVSPQGQILDPSPITVIAYQNSSDLLYSLASDGTNWAVVSEGTSAGEAAIRGARVAPDGTVLDPGGVVIVPETYFLRFGIELGGIPGEFLLAWNEWRSGTSDDVLAYRLSPSLQKIEATPFVIASHALYDMNAKIASNGIGFFVAWNVNDNYLSSDVYGARVTAAGQVLDPNGKAFSGAGIGYGINPAVTWDGTNWIAAWPNYGSGGLNAGRMSTTGAILDPGGVAMPNLGWGSVAGAAAGGFIAAWSDATLGSQDAFAASITSVLAPGARTCVSLGAPRQTEPAFAFNGNGSLCVFLSAGSAGSRILGQRLDVHGGAINPEPFEIVGPAGNYGPPSVAWDGSCYMVAYVDHSKIYARRVALDGTMIDPAPVLVMNAMESGISALDGVFLVVGNYAPSNPEYVFVFGTRMRGSDAAKLDSSPIPIGGSFSLHPKVATVGSRWLATWEQHPSHDDPHASVVANFVDGGGVAGSAFSFSAGMAAYNLAPAVAADQDTALVAWSEAREGFNNLGIYGRRILSSGVFLDGGELALSTAAGSQTRPAVGWDGTEFVTLFQDPRNNPIFFDEHLDVYGARVSPGGEVIDPDGFALANDPIVSEIQPAAVGGAGSALLGCAVFRPAAPYAAFRIGARSLIPLQLADVPGDPAFAAGVRMTASPNPSSASIEFRLAGPGREGVDLTIFDVAGHEIRRLYQGTLEPGSSAVLWDGADASGQRVSPGIYFARLRQAGSSGVLKITVR